jgi:hypothetical protein
MEEEAQYAELQGATKAAWGQLTQNKRERILKLGFVKRLQGPQLFFDRPYAVSEIDGVLRSRLEDLVGSSEISYKSTQELTAKRAADRLRYRFLSYEDFRNLEFGYDVAERDQGLMAYFVSTHAFARANSGDATVIIGPKGSGKTAILRALQSERGAADCIVITPEVFATSMLRQVLESNDDIWDEEQAFVATWIFTILVEVFKRVAANPKGVPNSALRALRAFLRDNTAYEELDLFSRFIGYLKKIEGVKLGPFELAVKTRMLQELFSLAPLYELVPKLRGVGGEILILLDELDQGWDNTAHANRFVGALLRAGLKIQSLGLRAHVVTFLRSEIFDIVKGNLDQLDKLRSSMETLRWSDGELADLIVRRTAHSLHFHEPIRDHQIEVAETLFDGSMNGVTGFRYLLSRTSLRPREVLQFVKHAHRLAIDSGAGQINPEILSKAESEFSTWKLEHICSEYAHIYPCIADVFDVFRGKGPILGRDDIILSIWQYQEDTEGRRPDWTRSDPDKIIEILYAVEFFGVPRPQPDKNRAGVLADYEFAFQRAIASTRSASSLLIHPALWSALEVPLA